MENTSSPLADHEVVPSKSDNIDKSTTLKKNKAKELLKKLLEKVKKHKKISIGVVVIIFILLIISIILLINSINKPGIKIAENIAEDKIYENYDYIYNSSDDKLIASTIDGLKQLEIISGEAKVVDYIISPDHKKVTYSISDQDYKSKIRSPNVDFTKLDFSPVALSVYELNLETGDNNLIWTTETIELAATTMQLYKHKQVVYPDSYALVSYPGITPYSYPISYTQMIDDVESGYLFTSVPFDLMSELEREEIKLLGYSSDGETIGLIQDQKLFFYNTNGEKLAENTIEGLYDAQNCSAYKGNWDFNLIKLTFSCWYGGHYPRGYDTMSKVYKVDSNFSISQAFDSNIYTGSYITATRHLALIPNNINFGEWYDILKMDISLYDLTSNSIIKVGETTEKNESVMRLETDSDSDIFFITSKSSDTSKDDHRIRKYTIYKVIVEESRMEAVKEFELPNDIYNISFDTENNTLSYYRKYSASTESIIEYRILDFTSLEEKELLNIKVNNDSVLYYNPKLVWFNHD